MGAAACGLLLIFGWLLVGDGKQGAFAELPMSSSVEALDTGSIPEHPESLPIVSPESRASQLQPALQEDAGWVAPIPVGSKGGGDAPSPKFGWIEGRLLQPESDGGTIIVIRDAAGETVNAPVQFDRDRRFRYRTGLQGSLTFYLRTSGVGQSDPMQIELDGGRTVDVGTIVIAGAGTIHGRLVLEGPGQTAVPFGRVTMFGKDGFHIAMSRVSAEGRFSLKGIQSEGKLRFSPMGDLRVTQGERATAGLSEHVITVEGVVLDVRCRMSGAVEDDPLFLPAKLGVTRIDGAAVYPEERATRYYTPDRKRTGSCFVGLALDCTYHFLALDDEGKSYEGSYQTRQGSGCDELILQQGTTLFGDVLVRARRQEMPRDAKLILMDIQQRGEMRLHIDQQLGQEEDERWMLLRGVPAGETELVVALVYASNWAVPASPQHVTVVPGGTVEVDLEVLSGGTIALSILQDESGNEEGVANVHVRRRGSSEWSPWGSYSKRARRGTSSTRRPHLARHGVAAIGQDPTVSIAMAPGLYDVAVDTQGRERIVAEVQVVAGVETALVVVLP